MLVISVLAKTEAQGVQPADVTAFQGQQVSFNCSGSDVSWNYVEELPQSPAKIFASPNTWFREKGTKYDVIGQYYLVVNDVQADSDAGIYQCDTNEVAATVLQAKLVVIGNISVNFLHRIIAQLSDRVPAPPFSGSAIPEVRHSAAFRGSGLGLRLGLTLADLRNGGPESSDSGRFATFW